MELRPPLHLGVVTIEKGAFMASSTKVTKFTFFTYTYWEFLQITRILVWWYYRCDTGSHQAPLILYLYYSNRSIYIYMYVYMCSPGGGRVPTREYIPSRHIRSSSRAIHPDLLIQHHLYVAWTGGPVVEFWLLHTVVVGSISSCGNHGVHCWWDLITSKQLFSVPYVTCRCLLDFLVMVILRYI